MATHSQSDSRLSYIYQVSHLYFFSVSQFAQNDNTAMIVNNFICITFIDCTTCHGPSFLQPHQHPSILQSIDQKKQLTNNIHKIGSLHHRFSHTVSHVTMNNFYVANDMVVISIALFSPERPGKEEGWNFKNCRFGRGRLVPSPFKKGLTTDQNRKRGEKIENRRFELEREAFFVKFRI
jgi:hypothetical protein